MIAVICLTAVALGLLAFLAFQQKAHQHAEDKWAEERRELCTRIQAPERIPVEKSEAWVIPERAPDEWAKVGTIELDDGDDE